MTHALSWMIAVVLFFSVAAVSPAQATLPEESGPPFARLREIATDSLTANIITLNSKAYLRAGSHQFQALWTRDFCYGSRGLFAIGRADVVKNQLSLLLDFTRAKDGLLPKMFDSRSAVWRYVNLVFRRWLPITDNIKHSYDAAIHPRITLDANALVLLTAHEYLQRTGDTEWWNHYLPKMVAAYHFYDRFLDDGLIRQGQFADWQDTVTRVGRSFYVNILYYAATERLAHFPEFGISAERVAFLKQKLHHAFYDPAVGLYASLEGKPYIGLDGILLALDYGFLASDSQEAHLLYENLKKHPLWTQNGGIPGFTSYPAYPKKWTPWLMRVGGVKYYHDYFYWSWEMGLAAKIARRMGDNEYADRILAELERMAVRDGAVFEVFRNTPGFPLLETIGYRAEGPFSWGASLVLDALN